MIPPTTAQRLAVRKRPADRGVMRQRWAGLLFLHWPIEPELIARRLPSGLHVDLFDGMAWIGVVPFFMQRVRPLRMPPMPGISWFLELNVRTYVHDDQGNPGVWFFSLDCNQPLAVEIARRFFHLPYEHAVMKAKHTSQGIFYHSRRRVSQSTGSDFIYQPPSATAPAAAGSLDWFLVERYLLFSTKRSGGLFSGQVNHTPYQIAPANCEKWSTETLMMNGFEPPHEPPASMLVAAPVDVTIYPLKQILRD